MVLLEAELQTSRGEVVTERVSECEQQLEAERGRAKTAEIDLEGGASDNPKLLTTALAELQTTTEALKVERRTTESLRTVLRRVEEKAAELSTVLEGREEKRHERYEEREREREARELRYYRALEAEREKWEAREQRALEEVDRLRKDKGGLGGVDVQTITEQIREANNVQQSLRVELSTYKRRVRTL